MRARMVPQGQNGIRKYQTIFLKEMERRVERGIETPGPAQYDMFLQNLTAEGRQIYTEYFADLKFAKDNSAPETKLPGTGTGAA